MHRSSVVMRRLAVALGVLALVVAVAAPVTLGAAKKKSHALSATIAARGVGTSGSDSLVAGVVKGKGVAGRGAVVYTISSNGNAKFTVFDRKGSLSGTATVKSTPGANGTTTVTSDGKVKGGTGAYKGATGKFTATGTIDSTGLVTLNATGTVKY